MKLFMIVIAICLYWLPLGAGSGDSRTGQPVFMTNCKTCHGAQGERNSAVAKVLKTEIPDLGSKDVQGLTDEELKNIITAGKGKMKPVKAVSGKQLDDVVAFVRSLAKP